MEFNYPEKLKILIQILLENLSADAPDVIILQKTNAIKRYLEKRRESNKIKDDRMRCGKCGKVIFTAFDSQRCNCGVE